MPARGGGVPDPASAAGGGPRPRMGPSVQRFPSGKACFLWKTMRAGTPRSAVPLPSARLPGPAASPRPAPGPGHPQADCAPNRLRARLLGLCPGLARCCPATGGTRQDAQSQGVQPSWGRGDFAPPLPPACCQPPCNNEDASNGAVPPRHAVPPLCPVPTALAWPQGCGEGQWWSPSFLLLLLPLGLFFHKGLLKHKQPPPRSS